MSSSNPGHEDEQEEDDDIERLFSLPLPPQTPSTSYFIDSPSFLPDDLLGFTEDFSLLFPDDHHYIPNYNPHPISLENTSSTNIGITHQGGIAQTGGVQLEQVQGDVGPSATTDSPSSSMMMEMKKKKMDHNAKERDRRLQLNASYLTLRSLLPDSNKPKEKWSAPYIIDRTLDHIPQLEVEIEKLKLNKKDMQSELEKARHLKQAHENLQENTLSVAINEIKKGHVIIQVCHHRNEVDPIFSDLLCRLEFDGMEVFDASAFDPCEDRSCYHIQIKMDESFVGEDDYVAELKEKVVSWLS